MFNVHLLRRAAGGALVAVLCFGALATRAADNAAAPDFVVTIKQGDTLIGLGERWLADPKRWPEVQRHNKISDPRLLVPGRSIAIPSSLLRTRLTDVTIRNVMGTARKQDGTPIAAGERLREGAAISTAENGYVTIELVDGSSLRLRPRSQLAIERARRVPGSDATVTRVQLPAGEAEVKFNPAVRTGAKFEIRTGYASSAVRGTAFRVRADERATRTEVTEGAITFAGLPTAGSTEPGTQVIVREGFGSVIDESRKPVEPVRLLAAPNLPREPVFQQAPTLRLAFPALDGAVTYRAWLATDPNFERVVGEAAVQQPEITFSGLAQGSYVLKVRAIDKLGLEGRDGTALIGMLPDRPPTLSSPGIVTPAPGKDR
jgi:hypothetical protein